MADVFISYSREDRADVEALAKALEAEGFSLWWDRQLTGGHDFSADIEQELQDAKAVLAVWSDAAAKSHWVRDEAGYGREQHKLVPISLDGSAPPIGFRQVHTIDYRSTARKEGFPALVAALKAQVGGVAKPTATAASTSAKAGWSRRKKMLAGLAAVLLLALAGVGLVASGIIPMGPKAEQWQDLTIAVLPIDHPGREDDRVQGVSLSQLVGDEMSGVARLSLLPVGTTEPLVKRDLSPREIGAQLGATHLVTGEYRVADGMATVKIALLDAKTGKQVWNTMQSGIQVTSIDMVRIAAEDLVNFLRTRLGAGGSSYVDAGDADPRAYELYLKGLESVAARDLPGERNRAIERFRSAISTDPKFVGGHAGLAYVLSLSDPVWVEMRESRWRDEVTRAMDAARAIDPDNVLLRAAEVHARSRLDHDIEGALDLGRRLAEEHPQSPEAAYAYGDALVLAGDEDGAIEYYDRAIELDPRNRTLRSNRSLALVRSGNLNRIRLQASRCNECVQEKMYWAMTLANFASQEEFERDWKVISKQLKAAGLGDKDLAETVRGLRAIISGKRIPSEGSNLFVANDSLSLAGEAAAGDADRALDRLENFADENGLFGAFSFLSDGRLSYSPEARTDPRYHAAFEHPFMKAIVAYRRKHGIMRGVPLAPSEVAAEKARLAALRR
ncbi:TIR domain-containing protein [Sphingomicrobium nitratireducens]|uniref:TIR domain-containing protein n=1 Tax=Sphingomicrobium nitratireducens TaxID=2964666 RepID=UPI00223F7E12